MKIKAALTIALLFSAGNISAQNNPQWDLETCIDYAIAHNIQIKQGINNVEASRLDREQAKFNYLPSLSANSSYNANFGRSLDPTTYQFVSNTAVNNVNGSASLNTQVFAGMLKLHTLKRSELNLLASMQDVERIKNEITMAIAAAYLQVLYNKEQIATSLVQIETITGQMVNTRKMVEAGSLPMGSLLEFEAQLSLEQYNLVTYQNNLVNATLTLTQLLELRDAPDFAVVVPDLEHIITREPESDVDAIYEIALDLPRVEVERLRRLAAEKSVSMAKARLYPTLGFNANYGSSYSDARRRPVLAPDGSTIYENYPFFDQFRDNASSSLSFSLQIPIFNALQARRNVKIARTTLYNQDLQLESAKNSLYKDIQQAYTDATGALNRFHAAESSVRNNEESFRYAEKRFNAGASTSVDYNLAKNNLITAQSSMIQAKYQYVFAMKILDFYRGIKITL